MQGFWNIRRSDGVAYIKDIMRAGRESEPNCSLRNATVAVATGQELNRLGCLLAALSGRDAVLSQMSAVWGEADFTLRELDVG
jgi:hypothetical protein